MSPVARVLAVVSCGVGGYFAAAAFVSSPSVDTPRRQAVSPPAPSAKPAGPSRTPAASDQPRLTAEWNQLRGAHGNTTADFQALYAEVKEIKDAFRRRAFRAALIAEWAAVDPQGGLAHLQKKESWLAEQLVREWMRIDPQAAISSVLALGKNGAGLLRGVLNDIVRAAPARLAEAVANLPDPGNRWDTSVRDAFALLSRQDPDGARTAAEALRGPMRGQALSGVVSAWAEKDGAAALEWAQALPAGPERDAAMKVALVGWAKTNPAAALDRLDLVPPGGDDMYFASDAGAQVLSEAARRDWNGTLRWLSDHPGKLGPSSMNGLMQVLSDHLNADPSGTLSLLARSGPNGASMALGNALLNDGYAQHQAIWDWLKDQPASPFVSATRSQVINAVAWKEPARAMELLNQLSGDGDSAQLLERGAMSLINGGQNIGKIDALLEKASPKLREHLLENAFQSMNSPFQNGPQHSSQEMERWSGRLNELPADRRANAASGLARAWASSDPQSAVKWALQLPEGPERAEAFSSATSVWLANDIYESSEWINRLPPGATRDIAARNLAFSAAKTEPETAWTWALSIDSQNEKLSALQSAYDGLRRKDPAIAQQMLQSANLPAQIRQALQSLPAQK